MGPGPEWRCLASSRTSNTVGAHHPRKPQGKKKAAPKDSFLSAPDTRTSPGVVSSPRRFIPTRCGRFESQWFPHPFLRGHGSYSVSRATCCMVSIVWAHDKDVSLAGIRFTILHPFGPVFAGGQRCDFNAASEETPRNPQSSLTHYPRRASWVGGYVLSTEVDRSYATGVSGRSVIRFAGTHRTMVVLPVLLPDSLTAETARSSCRLLDRRWESSAVRFRSFDLSLRTSSQLGTNTAPTPTAGLLETLVIITGAGTLLCLPFGGRGLPHAA